MIQAVLQRSVLHTALIAAVLGGAWPAARAQSEWKPAGGHLMTRWARNVSPENAWPEYPRPQMMRKEWKNLNGLWDYAVTERYAWQPPSYDGKILVPFCIESALSGVKKTVTPEQRLWYRRTFEAPAAWKGQRVLLHFGAVDWHAIVIVNGRPVGEHKGGYTPFWFDITEALKPAGDQELVVTVWDPTDTYTQPRGKQVREPRGIWYTAVTGIWQTVWLEPVPEASIERLRIVPDIDNQSVQVTVTALGNASGYAVEAVALDGTSQVAKAKGAPGQPLRLRISNPKLWSPGSPHLYGLRVELRRGQAEDAVESYFGMRKIALDKDAQGRLRLQLNNKPLFHFGPLDQGWWPDGLYTAPTDEALRYDVEATRDLGLNAARKHVKVEPARWYYHCDRLGLMVWQDMPSANLAPRKLGISPTDPEAGRDPESAVQFERELRELIDNFGHFPSIVMWVPFNEGWGQYDTARIAAWVKERDPTRLVNSASGWTDRGVGDVYDTHMYPGPGMEPGGPNRAAVLGEFGGLGLVLEGHLWVTDQNWGYQSYKTTEELRLAYRNVVNNAWGLLGFGLSAAIYTQTTDVEREVNGLMTYDRAVVKLDPQDTRKLHARFYGTSPVAKVVLSDSKEQPQAWSYTLEEPGAQWQAPDFDAAGWRQGPAPFQSGDDPLFRTGTQWTTDRIWIRRSFELERAPANLWATIFHSLTKGEVYLNGQPVLRLENVRETRRHYGHLDLSEHAGELRAGRNVIAVYGERDKGRRGIDIGLYFLER